MIEWIEKSLQLCIDPGDTPENSFEELQNEFNLFNENQRMEIIEILKQQLEANAFIYVLSRFVRYMSIKEFEETLICEIYNFDTDCFCGCMLELQIFSRIKGDCQL